MKTATKERPILFSGEMVRAILDGRKTQTRRVVKPQFGKVWGRGVRRNDDAYSVHVDIMEPSGEWKWIKCPYGKPGDRIWVRETWGLHDTQPSDGPENATVYYRATDGDAHELRYQLWRPSIHMPRWASRITLEVTEVRVERVQDISEEDAAAEGCDCRSDLAWGGCYGTDTTTMPQWAVEHGHRAAFKELWDSINGTKHPWKSNPWVWCVTFQRTEAQP